VPPAARSHRDHSGNPESGESIPQVLVGAVENDLAVIAGAIKAVHCRVDRADVELPAALE
jgi:hypothetical protein